MNILSTSKVQIAINTLELFFLCIVICLALIFQFFLHELPCPLCLLQRLGFFCMALGLLMNLKYGARPSHYALSLLSALFTAFVALRQIAIHIMPNNTGYGSRLWGLHMYTWSFILAILFVLFNIFILAIDDHFNPSTRKVLYQKSSYRSFCIFIFFAVFVGLILLNIISALLECGLSVCPDNPTSYLLFNKVLLKSSSV